MDQIDCEVRKILLKEQCSPEFNQFESFEDGFKKRSTTSLEYAGWRFINAWQNSQNKATPDLVVLLRQFIRWMPQSKLPGISDRDLPETIKQYLSFCGLKFNPMDELVAEPFVQNGCKIRLLINRG